MRRGQHLGAGKRSIDKLKFLTVGEVADALNVCGRTVRRWIDAEELVAHRFGAAVRIAESDLAVFIASHRAF